MGRCTRLQSNREPARVSFGDDTAAEQWPGGGGDGGSGRRIDYERELRRGRGCYAYPTLSAARAAFQECKERIVEERRELCASTVRQFMVDAQTAHPRRGKLHGMRRLAVLVGCHALMHTSTCCMPRTRADTKLSLPLHAALCRSWERRYSFSFP